MKNLLLLITVILFICTSCKKDILGCTYEFAGNYDTEATKDDGSCVLPPEEEPYTGLKIGDYHAGGIIFWLDSTNFHGLVCANIDQTAGMIGAIWGCEGDYIATSNDIGSGLNNTNLIIAENCSESDKAVELSYNLVLNGYSDWFLPSLGELQEMAKNRVVIDETALANGGEAFFNDYYWSSSTHSTLSMHCCNVYNQGGYQTQLTNYLY